MGQARMHEYKVVHAMRVQYDVSVSGVPSAANGKVPFVQGSGAPIAIPGGKPGSVGSMVVGCALKVLTALNYGTSSSLTVGDDTNGVSSIMTSTTAAPTATGDKAGVLFPLFTADTVPGLYITGTGTAATTGKFDCTVLYFPYTN